MDDHAGTLDYGPANELHQLSYPEQKPVCRSPLKSESRHMQGSHRPHLKISISDLDI